ncbi:MAG: CerR family C-terminal domain-containing protein [Alphaproteobacteria bacterium]
MPIKQKHTQSSAGQTRAALIEASLRLFGDKGYDAASTRDIAAAANANIASIAYHFGGKEGLRLACAEAIVAKFRDIAGSATVDSDPGGDAEKATAMIEAALTAMIRFIVVNPEARPIAAFMMREMGQPSAAIDLIYAEMMYPFHAALCRLWGVATDDDPESPETRLAVFSLLGQVAYFRLAQPIILRRMNWKAVGPSQADQIIATITGNLKAQISAAKDADDV